MECRQIRLLRLVVATSGTFLAISAGHGDPTYHGGHVCGMVSDTLESGATFCWAMTTMRSW